MNKKKFIKLFFAFIYYILIVLSSFVAQFYAAKYLFHEEKNIPWIGIIISSIILTFLDKEKFYKDL
jgi:hypothetical protein